MSFKEKSIDEFMLELSSSAPVPGGGGASALVAAIGCALGNMVGSLTTGKKKYADVEEDIRALMERSEDLRTRCLRSIDEDAKAFAPLAAAYGIPKDDPGRDAIMEDALKTAAYAPLEIMRLCSEAIDVTDEYEKKGSRLAVSDAGCSAILLKAAMQAASLNVFINTKSMKDRDTALKIENEADDMLERYTVLADEIFIRSKA